MNRNWRIWIRWLLVAWTSPNSVIGLAFGVLALLTGGRAQIRRGCIEFHGGFVKWLLSRLLNGQGAAAMTLGHTILGQTPAMLHRARDHEHVHVRQYERWGPFFLPAYIGSSLVLWIRGCDSYLENPFEIEAYRLAPLNPQSQQPSAEGKSEPLKSQPPKPLSPEANVSADDSDCKRG